MPKIKLDTSDIDERFWSIVEQERVTFENNQSNGSTSLPLEYNSETNNE
jgi:hypothetical protein